MSEKVVTRQQVGFVRRQKRAVGTLRHPWSLLCSPIPCVEGRRSIRMCESEGEMENPCWRIL